LKNPVPITALAITLNEAERMQGFLESLSFADQIIVVDSYSTDQTIEIARGFDKVQTYQRTFDNFSAQKNYAISKASNDWILFFDPDEEVTPELRDEILRTIKNPNAVAYYVKRSLYFMGKRIKYSGFQTDWVVRLFNKGHCHYDGSLVHETIQVNGKSARLKARLPHHTYRGIDDYTGKLHQYSALQAKTLHQKGKRPSLWQFFFRPWYRFWHQYIIRLGILDGKEGFILAYINAFSVFKRYANLWLRYRKIN